MKPYDIWIAINAFLSLAFCVTEHIVCSLVCVCVCVCEVHRRRRAEFKM